MRLIILRPCRVSFALCCFVAFFVDAEAARDLSLGEPPRPIPSFQPQERPIQ